MVSFLADSDDEQDGTEPANGPSTMPDDRIKAVQAELEAYLSKLASEKSVDQLMWWSVSAATYPVLSAVAPSGTKQALSWYNDDHHGEKAGAFSPWWSSLYHESACLTRLAS